MRLTRLCALRRASFGCCARSDLLADLYLAGQDVHAVWQQCDDRVLDLKTEQPQLHLRRAIASPAPTAASAKLEVATEQAAYGVRAVIRDLRIVF